MNILQTNTSDTKNRLIKTFDSLTRLTQEISDCFNYNSKDVRERLESEMLQTGYNVSSAAKQFGVHAHLYNEKMERFYKESDAFVFELAIDGINPIRIKIFREIFNFLSFYFLNNKKIRILDIGGGIGTDVIRFWNSGYHDLTYFEFDGFSSQFVHHLFKKNNVGAQILSNPKDIPKNYFDVIICINVLEHTFNPPELINKFKKYLKEDGVVIVNEVFHQIKPRFPTHLESNRRYIGQIINLFKKENFIYGGPISRLGWPLVFIKSQDISTISKDYLFKNKFNIWQYFFRIWFIIINLKWIIETRLRIYLRRLLKDYKKE